MSVLGSHLGNRSKFLNFCPDQKTRMPKPEPARAREKCAEVRGLGSPWKCTKLPLSSWEVVGQEAIQYFRSQVLSEVEVGQVVLLQPWKGWLGLVLGEG